MEKHRERLRECRTNTLFFSVFLWKGKAPYFDNLTRTRARLCFRVGLSLISGGLEFNLGILDIYYYYYFFFSKNLGGT